MKTMEKAIAFDTLMALQNIGSRVNGRRNYVIQVTGSEKNITIGTYKTMRSHGRLEATIASMIKNGITWLFYTYKKDFLADIKSFEENGWTVYYWDDDSIKF